MAINQLVPKFRASPIVVNIERILQPYTDFIRGNPIVSTAAIGAGVTGLTATATSIIKRKKTKKKSKTRKKRKTTKRKTVRRRKKRTKAEIKRIRLRNLKKARAARRKGTRKRKIIRGRGLGRREIKHSGRGTKGKHKVVSFRTKSGKLVRFKSRR